MEGETARLLLLLDVQTTGEQLLREMAADVRRLAVTLANAGSGEMPFALLTAQGESALDAVCTLSGALSRDLGAAEAVASAETMALAEHVAASVQVLTAAAAGSGAALAGTVRYLSQALQDVLGAALPALTSLESAAALSTQALTQTAETDVSEMLSSVAAMRRRAVGAVEQWLQFVVRAGAQALAAGTRWLTQFLQAALQALGSWSGRWDVVWAEASRRTLQLWRQLVRELQALGSDFGQEARVLTVQLLTVIARGLARLGVLWRQDWSELEHEIDIIWKALTERSREGVSLLLEVVQTLLDTVLSLVRGFAPEFAQAGEDLIEGLKQGILRVAGDIAQAARSVVENAINAAKAALGIHSPSAVFQEIGQQTVAGFVAGVASQMGAAQEAVRGLATAVQQPFGIGSALAQPSGGLVPGHSPAVNPTGGAGRGGVTVLVTGNTILNERMLDDLATRVGQVLVQQTRAAYPLMR
ncbi:MAG: hypothetical protein M1118_06830 [Chloroflexi bacterium]|nr:hypothetical protein [Chloroflexota bacterium]